MSITEKLRNVALAAGNGPVSVSRHDLVALCAVVTCAALADLLEDGEKVYKVAAPDLLAACDRPSADDKPLHKRKKSELAELARAAGHELTGDEKVADLLELLKSDE